MKTTEIPIYLIAEWHRHLKRIVEKANCDPSDTGTLNAIRLARKDLLRMNRYIPKKT